MIGFENYSRFTAFSRCPECDLVVFLGSQSCACCKKCGTLVKARLVMNGDDDSLLKSDEEIGAEIADLLDRRLRN